jgi:methionyl-tRNA formyltransferase
VNLIFFGTSEFACPALRTLDDRYGVDLVVTQPDRPVGRHAVLQPSAVKRTALERELPLMQPARVNAPESVEALRALSPDAIVVASYGQLLKPSVFEIPRWGTLNIHASLLPAYRGAAPIHWALIHGETKTGITTFVIDQGLDTGDILLSESLDIDPDEDAAQLESRLADLGADLILRTLAGLSAGSLRAEPQSEHGVTLAPTLTREDGRIDWNQPARRIHNLVRGTVPWPGAWTEMDGQRIKIHRTAMTDLAAGVLGPGEIGPTVAKRLLIGTADHLLEVLELQREGKGRVSGAAFLHGSRLPASFT